MEAASCHSRSRRAVIRVTRSRRRRGWRGGSWGETPSGFPAGGTARLSSIRRRLRFSAVIRDERGVAVLLGCFDPERLFAGFGTRRRSAWKECGWLDPLPARRLL